MGSAVKCGHTSPNTLTLRRVAGDETAQNRTDDPGEETEKGKTRTQRIYRPPAAISGGISLDRHPDRDECDEAHKPKDGRSWFHAIGPQSVNSRRYFTRASYFGIGGSGSTGSQG